ncbi:MAG TPA: glycosyltransferase family 2 protein [Acidimicrobiia bacterium]|nr:glycosyltransferase family 2 protein [Acidimicrobiia bacterium]
MIPEILLWVGYATLAYFIVMQVYMVGLGLRSAAVMRRSHHLERFGRVSEMLSSRTSPPVTIVIPAYNEAAGIVDSIRSMSIVGYPRFEIVVVNDGSIDETLEAMIEAFHLERVRIPYRPDIPTAPIRAIYRGHGAVDITVIDKENGGRADALNAGINAARYPYALCTDADVILDANCLVGAMRRVVEDRQRTIAVGGNIRPLNGSRVHLGHLVEAGVPRKLVPRMQALEYLRTFLASRPAWSEMGALPLVSGAFGVWKRSAVIAVGGFTTGHMGEDMDITMRMHRYHIDNHIPYRIVYEPSAVIWTEVPETLRVLRRQRVRWHRGLMTAVRDFMPMTFNPRYGKVGTVTWAAMFLFEYLAPIIEFVGWITIPLALLLGTLNVTALLTLLALAFGVGLLNSLVALLLDESYGYFNSPADTARLIVMVLIENFGMRQLTVAWRVRAILGGKGTRVWGNMERKGVANLGVGS